MATTKKAAAPPPNAVSPAVAVAAAVEKVRAPYEAVREAQAKAAKKPAESKGE